LHQCVRCNKLYPDGSNEILKGCTDCKGRFFFFVKKEALEKAQEITHNLTREDKDRIEKDVMDILGIDDEKPVILDLASVNILGAGKFELDLVRLFKGEPMVYRLEEGKYFIDIAQTFMNNKKLKDEEKK